MKPGDLIRLRDGCGSASFISPEPLPARPDGPYFPPGKTALVIKIQESVPPPGCSKSVLLLGTNGLGWLPNLLQEHFLEVIS